MLSLEDIRTQLLQIAENNNLTGESVNMCVDQLAYTFYNIQLETINAVQESNLSTAKLLNSKIRNCMNVMYSVYRGKNARVKLNFVNRTLLEYKKFDVIYTSNTFKVYAEDSIRLTSSVDSGTGNYNVYTLIGILSSNDLLETTINITETNKYYVDFIIDNEVLSNLSEEVQVFINDIEYPITRNFFDHIRASIPLKNYDAYQINDSYYYVLNNEWIEYTSDGDVRLETLKIKGTLASKSQLPNLPSTDLDPVFILTIPDYGIRVYKRSYFNVSDRVKIRALQYTTKDDINSDEFSKITITGTELTNSPLVDDSGNIIVVTRRQALDEEGNPTYLDNGLIMQVDRDNENSILYNANLYQRLQSSILSKSDINALFTEYFIDQIKNSINWYTGEDNFSKGIVYIFYVPKVDYDTITDTQMEIFRARYGSYFLSNQLECLSGILVTVDVQLVVYMDDYSEIGDEVATIFNDYEYQLNDPDNTDVSLIKPKQIFADISKLSNVAYIDELTYVSYNSEGTDYPIIGNDTSDIPTFYENKELGINVPTYYKFNVNIVYRNSYENI